MAIVTFDDSELSKQATNINVMVYQKPEKISDVLSKARLRIFYKGMNRNRTFISEEFALKLEKSLPYTPIKGIYDNDNQDFESHGEEKSEGRIYGIVPENPNSQYEDYLDDDGITRSYLCCDVYLFTGLYNEAEQIVGKSQSMELFSPTLKFEYRLDEKGKPFIYFLDGCFVGLQVLGELVEPCFEGSSFFALYSDIQKITTYIKKYEQQEAKKVDNSMFRLSDSEKYNLLWDILNPNETYTYCIIDVYDDYAIAFNRNKKIYERIYYTKDNDTITIGDIVQCYIIDVTKSEYEALETMKAMNGANYESINDNFVSKTELTALQTEKTQFEATIEELKQSVSQSEVNTQQLQENLTQYEKQIQDLQAEKDSIITENNILKSENQQLSVFKCQTENEKKEQVISKFEEILTDSTLNEFKLNKDKYDVQELEKELCLAAFKSNPTIFSKEVKNDLVYKQDSMSKHNSEMSSCERLIDNYKRNGGNK